MFTHTPARLALLAAGACMLALAGCSAASPPDAEEASTVDGSFTLYSGRDEELIQPLIDKFETETEITVDVRQGNTAELGALLLEEGEQSPAQVFLTQDAGALGALSNADLFADLPDDIAKSVPAGFTSTDASWVGVTGRARVIVNDGAKLAADQVPTSVAAFAESEWACRVEIAPNKASFQAFVTAYRVIEGEAVTDTWLAGVAANDPQIFENNRAVPAAVNDGVVEVGLINHYYWFAQAPETGAENMRAAGLPRGRRPRLDRQRDRGRVTPRCRDRQGRPQVHRVPRVVRRAAVLRRRDVRTPAH